MQYFLECIVSKYKISMQFNSLTMMLPTPGLMNQYSKLITSWLQTVVLKRTFGLVNIFLILISSNCFPAIVSDRA